MLDLVFFVSANPKFTAMVTIDGAGQREGQAHKLEIR